MTLGQIIGALMLALASLLMAGAIYAAVLVPPADRRRIRDEDEGRP